MFGYIAISLQLSSHPKLKQLARNLRNNSTLSEVLFWNEIKSKKILGCQFLRQKPIGNFIVDFYCSKAKLVIELDGGQHFEPEYLQKDIERDKALEGLGLHVLRFDNPRKISWARNYSARSDYAVSSSFVMMIPWRMQKSNPTLKWAY